MRVRSPSPPCLASITVMQSAFTRWNRGQHPGGVFKRRWRNGKRARLLTGTVGVRILGGVRRTHAPLEEWITHPALNQKIAGLTPARSTQQGPIVYGLGSGVFTPGNGVRLPVGLQRVGGAGTSPGS
jgi:hypothetical protein